jgi:hypothetical protein
VKDENGDLLAEIAIAKLKKKKLPGSDQIPADSQHPQLLSKYQQTE